MSEFHDKSRPGSQSEAMDEVDDAPLAAALVEIAADLTDLRVIVQDRLRNDATKDEAFRKLYVDLEHFRGQAAFIQTRPLFIDLILLIDRVESNMHPSTRAHKPETETLLVTIRDELLEILARRSVEPLVCEPSAAFDPHLQRAIRVEPTSSPLEHNLTQFVRRGYMADGQLLRPEDVVVLRHTPPPPTEHTLL